VQLARTQSSLMYFSTPSWCEPAVCNDKAALHRSLRCVVLCGVAVGRGCRVAKRAAEVAAEEAVPWAARDPSTQACALMYGVMQIHKVCASVLAPAVFLGGPLGCIALGCLCKSLCACSQS
jgi:hypothetical protein